MEINTDIMEIFCITLYKLCSLATGTTLSYLGYKLFKAGIWGNAGDASGSFGSNKIVIKKAAPGTFFVLMGALVICTTVYQGMDFITETTPIKNVKKINISKELMDEKPTF